MRAGTYYEQRLRSGGFRRIAGADEAGRGALAGPLVAAAVVLRDLDAIEGLSDSKLLSRQRRETLFEEILAAASVAVVRVSPGRIDREGIQPCNLWALGQALARLEGPPDYGLCDGFPVRGAPFPVLAVKKGDRVCASIAAASIVAKVTRDRLMARLAARYPGYGFERHAGYGTEEHLAALVALGPCPAHRRSFARVGQGVLPGLEVVG
ncbi:MAG: ribonuclease HII [Actinomycetota bacterium]